MAKEFEFSLAFSVVDAAKLVAAARERAIAEGLAGDDATAAEIVTENDLALAARILLDPGALAGCSIIDSVSE